MPPIGYRLTKDRLGGEATSDASIKKPCDKWSTAFSLVELVAVLRDSLVM